MGKLEESADRFEQALNKNTQDTVMPTTPDPSNIAPPVIVPVEPAPVIDKLAYDFDKLSADIGEPIKSLDDLRSIINSRKELNEKVESYKGLEEKVKTTESSVAEYLKTISEKDELLSKYSDPLSHFGGDADEYKRMQIKLSLKNSGDPKNIDAAMRLIDGGNLSDFDTIKLYKIYNNPKADESTVDKLLAKKFELDLEDRDNWDGVSKLEMAEEAAKIKSEFLILKDSIKLPEKIDFSSKKKEADETAKTTSEKNKKDWESVKEKLPFDELKFNISEDIKENGENKLKEIPFSYTIPENDKKSLQEIAVKIATENNIPFNDKEYKSLMEDVLDRYEKINRAEIDKAKYNHWKSLWQEEHDKKEHVGRSSDKSDAPGIPDSNWLAGEYQKASKDLKGGK